MYRICVVRAEYMRKDMNEHGKKLSVKMHFFSGNITVIYLIKCYYEIQFHWSWRRSINFRLGPILARHFHYPSCLLHLCLFLFFFYTYITAAGNKRNRNAGFLFFIHFPPFPPLRHFLTTLLFSCGSSFGATKLSFRFFRS